MVYVDSFSGQSAAQLGAKHHECKQSRRRRCACWRSPPKTARTPSDVPNAVTGGTSTLTDDIRRNDIEPALRRGDWAGAAVAAANGLNTPTSTGVGMSWFGLLVVLAILVVAVLLLWLWMRRRRRKRREAEFAAAKRVDPSDPNALAAVPIDALDDLSKAIVVDVDNAVRTSDNELALAVEEFGTAQTEPFSRAVANARTTLAQAFNVRQILDDAVPETPQQRRDLLTRVVVAAAKADRELDAQREAFEKLRDLVINAPSRLDALTQQMVDLTARIGPSEQALAALHNQFAATALASVADNVETAKQRLAFADQNITNARGLVARPAGQQMGLVDAIRAAESSLGQARTLLDAVDSAATDINRAVATLPSAIADIQNGINQAGGQLQQRNTPQAAELSAARDAAAAAVADAQKSGSSDPLGTFTRLTKADADLDRLLASVAEEREAAERLSPRVRSGVVHRPVAGEGRVGLHRHAPRKHRSRGADPARRGPSVSSQAALDKGETNTRRKPSHMPTAPPCWPSQAQSLANDDVRAAQRSYTSGYGGGGSDMGAVIGGIIIGNILRGGFSADRWRVRRRLGRRPGHGSSTSYGGSSRSSGRSYSGGRF